MITTLTGENSFALKAELHQRVKDFVSKQGDMALEKLDGEEVEFERITEALQSLPFLASQKLVVLHTPGANKKFTEEFEKLLPTISETTDVIMVEPKLDKRTQYYKTLKAKTDFKEFNELDENSLARWLVDEAKRQNAELSSTDARYLISRVGTNQQMLANELKKLLTYEPKISRGSIDLLTEPTPQSSIFNLLDAALAGQTKQMLKLYEQQRAQKVEPQQIIAMLTWQLHVLAVIKTAEGKSDSEIARDAKLNPYVIGKSRAIAKELTFGQLKTLVSNLVKLEQDLKSISIDADDALQAYLLGVTE